MKNLLGKCLFVAALCGVTSNAMASFTETAIGNAVVNDASAVYYNPASLTLLPNKQLYMSGAIVNTLFAYNGIQNIPPTPPHLHFQGKVNSRSSFYLPAVYFAVPISDCVTIGIGEVFPFDALLDYHPDTYLAPGGYRNELKVIDFTLGMGVKINDKLSVGAGIDIERFIQEIKFSFSIFNPPTPRVINKGFDWSYTGHGGILFTPREGTYIGLTYHGPVRFKATGESTGYGLTRTVHTNAYNYSVLFPASQVLTLDQYLNPCFGVLTTIERVQWSSIGTVNFNDIVVGLPRLGPVQLAQASTKFNFRDAWRFLVGIHYALNEKWLFRSSVSWDQTPIKRFVVGPNTPFTNGWIIGLSAAHNFSKCITGELAYAHSWYQATTLKVTTPNAFFNGRLHGSRDAFQAKLIWNII